MKKTVLFLLLFLFFCCRIFAKESVQSAILHNDGYALFQEFRPNDANFKMTIREMEELARRYKSKVFSQSASLLKTIRNKCRYYYDTNVKLIDFFKKKWSKPHYVEMNEEWKEKTFEKDRKKVKDLHSLSLGMQRAYNDWNKSRNEVVKLKTDKKIIKGFKEANLFLKKSVDAVLSEEERAFDAVAKELEIIKMSK